MMVICDGHVALRAPALTWRVLGIAMWKRWGLGPVFAYESLLNARRWQVYAGRSLFVLVMLVGMTIVWITWNQLTAAPATKLPIYKQMAKLGEGFFFALAGIQISLVMLAAPAAAAGSVCVDRARGTLLHVMVTDLSDIEIVLGKLGARLAPIFGLIACGVPVAYLSALLGGIEFGAIVGSFVVSLSLALLACTLALTISVWAAKTHEVLMAVYMVLGLWLLALPIWGGLSSGGRIMAPPAWFEKANPYVLVFAPYNKPGSAGIADFAAFAGVAIAVSAALTVVSIARLRKIVIEQSGRSQKAYRRRLPELARLFPSWPTPQLDGNPVLWREWSRNQPSRLARRLWAVLFLIIWTSMAWGTYESISDGTNQSANGFGFGMMILLMFGMLMLSATAPTALADERARGSLDALLATPLSTQSILAAKWWGMYRRVLVLAAVPLYAVLFIAATVPDIPVWLFAMRFPQPAVPLNGSDRIFAPILCVADFLASGALIVSWGLALATWVPRLGRAVALSVIAFFLFGLGWPLLIDLMFSQIFSAQAPSWTDQNRVLKQFLTSLSPLVGPMNPIRILQGFEFEVRRPLWMSIGTAVVVKSAIAGLLFWLTIKTFDRCLGRVPESRFRAHTRSRAVRVELVPGASGS
jgi:ABC-type transport system involved in multi-copper enzyme maturation permease subunit